MKQNSPLARKKWVKHFPPGYLALRIEYLIRDHLSCFFLFFWSQIETVTQACVSLLPPKAFFQYTYTHLSPFQSSTGPLDFFTASMNQTFTVALATIRNIITNYIHSDNAASKPEVEEWHRQLRDMISSVRSQCTQPAE